MVYREERANHILYKTHINCYTLVIITVLYLEVNLVVRTQRKRSPLYLQKTGAELILSL